jgi:nitrogen regulatory protein P-II 1
VEARKVTAIVRRTVLEKVEERLQAIRVPGMSVTTVKGYGEYADFFRHDWQVDHARIEIFTGRRRATQIAEAIVDAAHTGAPGDGIVVVLPVETVYRIRTRAEATGSDLD